MAAHWIWFILAVLALIGEVLTGTFYVLVVAVGLFAGGLAAWAGAPLWACLATAAAVTLGVMAVLHRLGWLGRGRRRLAPGADPDMNLDVGQVVTVDGWRPDGSARVWYRGTHWEAELAAGHERMPGEHEIVELHGNRLVLRPHRR